MAEQKQVYKCNKCGNIIEVLHGGGGTLVCCGKPMELLDEQTADQSLEKHVPVIEKQADGYRVTVGSVLHPMLEKHFIEWIELIADGGRVYRKHLKPGDKPQAFFKCRAKHVIAREFCNIHGQWKSEA